MGRGDGLVATEQIERLVEQDDSRGQNIGALGPHSDDALALVEVHRQQPLERALQIRALERKRLHRRRPAAHDRCGRRRGAPNESQALDFAALAQRRERVTRNFRACATAASPTEPSRPESSGIGLGQTNRADFARNDALGRNRIPGRKLGTSAAEIEYADAFAAQRT